MMNWIAGGLALLYLGWRAQRRLLLSRAKHPSLAGHGRMSRRLARQVPRYEYPREVAFAIDGAPEAIRTRRESGFARLQEALQTAAPETLRQTDALRPSVSDLQFTDSNRVPYQFRSLAAELPIGALARATDGTRLEDLDGNRFIDAGGSYGANLLGHDFYRDCIDRGVDRARQLGAVLGPYHEIINTNVERLRTLTGLDEVSFHMSGTEAVMQAVRLARFHTGRPKLVMFCGAYHGWWDGVQPGIGNGRSPRDIFMLREMNELTLKLLRRRNDIACVLINPLQALAPNRGPGGDALLIEGRADTRFDRNAYGAWLRDLREVCTERGIALIFDDVFLGFRLGPSGTAGFFGVQPDMVTLGKTLGGGLPVGALCGRAHLMARFRENRPTDLCFARGTFNSHPYVMTCMHEFLERATSDEFRAQSDAAPALWDARFAALNERLQQADLPVQLRNMVSVATVVYTRASRYHWLFQYYLREAGIALGWIGTGRLIFSHDFSDSDFEAFCDQFVGAAQRMADDGFWWEGAGEGKAMRREVLAEILRERFRGSGSARPGLQHR